MWISTFGVVIYICVSVLSSRLNVDSLLREKLRSKRSLDFNTYDNSVKLRHHSRFPHLDSVMTKLDDMRHDEKVGVSKRHSSSMKTTSTTPRNEINFGNYPEDQQEKEDNQIDDDDNPFWDEYEDDEQYLDYEEMFSDSDMDWQAEEPTTTTTTLAPIRRGPMSPISQLKWQMYGTRSKVEENRNKELYNTATEKSDLARKHYMRIHAEGTCKTPLPRVISVQNEHPDDGKIYTPHCTVLHRCTEDTGCCTEHHQKCGPIKEEVVHLYFYVRTLGNLQVEIEKLSFSNHTECTCLDKKRIETSTEDINGIEGPSHNGNSCKCPKSFQPTFNRQRCTCDCDKNLSDCIRMKNGLEYFGLADRMCILDNKCGPPVCEFGSYIRLKGRCPNKEEKFRAFESVNI